MELNYDDFVASNGWLYRFQQRHMIKCNILSGEAADVSDSVVQDWQKRLPDLCRNYSPANTTAMRRDYSTEPSPPGPLYRKESLARVESKRRSASLYSCVPV